MIVDAYNQFIRGYIVDPSKNPNGQPIGGMRTFVNIMNKITIKQVRSRIGRPIDQKRTLDALGLKKINSTVEHNSSPQILGMVKKVSHLIKVL